MAAVSKQNVNAALVFEFMYKMVEVMVNYFGKVTEARLLSRGEYLYQLQNLLGMESHQVMGP